MNETHVIEKKAVPAMLADTEQLFREAREGSRAFLAGKPFPHLLLPSLIKPVCHTALFEGLRQEANRNTSGQHNRYSQQEWPAVLRHLVWELSSSTLLRHFASLTGTPPLLPDPFLWRGGVCRWFESAATHAAEQEYVWRHPDTGLQNALRFELFASNEKNSKVQIELRSPDGHVDHTITAGNGSALFVASDQYNMRYRCEHPQHWYSFIVHFYVNDRARPTTGGPVDGY